MRGLMTNTKGEIIDEPVKSNFMEGLSVLEYFTSTHGARKGQADTALRTADSGYLTRRLVDVSQDVVVNDEDCGSEGYVDLPLYLEGGRSDANDSVAARFLARDLVNPETGEVVATAGTDITPGLVATWREELPRETLVPVRTPSKCESPHGVCQTCYGRALSTYRPVDVGEAVGIIAAQSIGEPGTQLTMRTFHTGGIAGEDFTAGLPRVVEIFEARHPKAEAVLAEIDGTVSLEETDSDRLIKVVITSPDNTEVKEYKVERQLLRTEFVEGADRFTVLAESERVEEEEGKTAPFHTVLMGITKASLATDSFLSAASFQETARVLTDAAIEGKVDGLAGLKENVIIGKLIPAATGLPRYRRLTVAVEGYRTQDFDELDIAAS